MGRGSSSREKCASITRSDNSRARGELSGEKYESTSSSANSRSQTGISSTKAIDPDAILFGEAGPRRTRSLEESLPPMYRVSSSNVHSLGYDHGSQTLYAILGPEQRLYMWAKVSEYTYDQLMEADSKGKFIHQFIKGQYESEHLETLRPNGK